MGSSDEGRGEADRQWVSEVERAEGEMDLRFLKVMVRFCFVVGMGMSMSMVIARWSEICRLWLVNCWMLRLVEQTKSRM